MKPGAYPSADNSRCNYRFYILLVLLLLIILGSKLWLIRQAGTDLPDWDQWDGEGGNLLMPFFHGKLSFWDLFKAHNEHRILFHRLLCLATVLLNGQWDARVEMVAGALIHTLTALALFWILVRLAGARMSDWIFLQIAVAFAMPFWENTLSGFQSQFYFLLLLSIVSMALLVLNRPFTWQWLAGLLLAFLCLFTMASGVLAACAAFALLLVRFLKDRRDTRQFIGVALAFLLIIGVALLFKVSVPDHERLKAQSITEFIDTLGKNLAWPNSFFPPLAFFNFLPLAVLGLVYLQSKAKDQRAEEMTLVLGIWGSLQAAAIAYARGADGSASAWRYMDLLSIGMIANGMSIVVLFSRFEGKTLLVRFGAALSAAWAIACGLGLYSLSERALDSDIPRHKFFAEKRVEHVRAFVASDDMADLTNQPEKEIPFPDPQYLAYVLRDVYIRTLLPASVRPALHVRQQNPAEDAFIPGGIPPEFPAPGSGETCWGSYSREEGRAEGTFESLPLHPLPMRLLKFELAGWLGTGYQELKLIAVDSGRETVVHPRHPALLGWQPLYLRAPAGKFRIVATDDHDRRWFAFKEPKETGYYSYLADRAVALGKHLFFIGLFTAVFIFLAAYFNKLAYRKTT
ncbi:MAG: hypothetical protein HYV35_09220 [Lentisphaerae bacterium]|nr:hypothetical protein [Lentisphaerota bacterium]